MNILTIAKGKNLEMKNRLTILEIENRKLKQQVEYATSSAFIEQQTRDKFGLGNENDAWLILPEEKDYNLGISLFTR